MSASYVLDNEAGYPQTTKLEMLRRFICTIETCCCDQSIKGSTSAQSAGAHTILVSRRYSARAMSNELKITQGWIGHRVSYLFGDDKIRYTRTDLKGSRTSSFTYESIAFRSSFEITAKNEAGFVAIMSCWLGISVVIVGSLPSVATFGLSASLFCLSMFLLFSGVLRVTMTCFPLFGPASAMVGGPIIVLNRKNSEAVLRELEERWRSAMRRRYFRVNPAMSIESTRANLSHLLELGLIDERELEDAVASAEAQQAALMNSGGAKSIN